MLFQTEEVWQWPEFQAFAARLNIHMESANFSLGIDMDSGFPVKIHHTYWPQIAEPVPPAWPGPPPAWPDQPEET